jgi:hypothetical protein
MQDQQKATKVTLYLPQSLHRQLKIRSAVDGEAMSAIAERALEYYMSHADVVNGDADGFGHTHQVYSCPACSESVVLRDGELVAVKDALSTNDEELSVDMQAMVPGANMPDEGELVTC